MTPQQIDEAAELWAAGVLGKQIVQAVGTTMGSFKRLCRNKRDMFPARENYQTRRSQASISYVKKHGTIRWTTHSGAQVTLASLSILENDA